METLKTAPKVNISNASVLEKELDEIFKRQVKSLAIDMEETFYISSTGLRALLSAQKRMNAANGELLIRNVRPQIRDIFDVTGFSGFLNLED